jgi:hypothetical protein
MKRTSKKRRPRPFSQRRTVRALWRFPILVLSDVIEEPIVWLAIAAGLLYRFGLPFWPHLAR